MTIRLPRPWYGDLVRVVGGLLHGQVGRVVGIIEPTNSEQSVAYWVEIPIAGAVTRVKLRRDQTEPAEPVPPGA